MEPLSEAYIAESHTKWVQGLVADQCRISLDRVRQELTVLESHESWRNVGIAALIVCVIIGAALFEVQIHSALRARHAALVSTHSRLQTDHSSKEKAYSALLARNTQLQADHSALLDGTAQLNADHSLLLAENTELHAENSRLTVTLEDAQLESACDKEFYETELSELRAKMEEFKEFRDLTGDVVTRRCLELEPFTDVFFVTEEENQQQATLKEHVDRRVHMDAKNLKKYIKLLLAQPGAQYEYNKKRLFKRYDVKLEDQLTTLMKQHKNQALAYICMVKQEHARKAQEKAAVAPSKLGSTC